MPLDAICLTAVKNELSQSITGMKIDKIQQPERDCLILSLRGFGGSEKLLVSAGSADGRIHLTNHQFENPAAPPMFCMLLRKHLTGGKITKITQPVGERLVELHINAPDSLGAFSDKRLIIELLGRGTNIILTDADGIIIDCLRRVGGELNDKRTVLPGLLYRPPPVQEGKLYPGDITCELWDKLYEKVGDSSADKWLIDTFFAMPPLICRELSHRAYGETDYRLKTASDGGAAFKQVFLGFAEAVKNAEFTPVLLTGTEGEVRDFSYTDIKQYGTAYNTERAKSFSELLDGFYTRAAQRARVKRRGSEMTKTVKNARDRLVRKLAAQKIELEKTNERDYMRECGDLIKANIHLIKKGDNLLKAQDFYAPDGAIREIKLDPLKTPQQNAAKYYKSYSKAKTARTFLTEQISLAEGEAEYLESVLEEISLAEGELDLEEIRQELKETGYIKRQKQNKKAPKKSAPMRFVSSAGVEIFAGRNNVQNDILTLKTARRSDIWLHTKNIHGSHVIISCLGDEPDDKTLSEAAAIAAYYSASRGGGKVPVDYCRVKHVKKPSGARPGAVIYTDYKTILAEPDEKLADSLRQK